MDLDHLERMTLGDRQLEREVLKIFVRQAAIMLPRIATAAPAVAAAAAHTLLGSARGIGAWRVAQAAEWLEHAVASQPKDDALMTAINELGAAVTEACTLIDARLGDRRDAG